MVTRDVNVRLNIEDRIKERLCFKKPTVAQAKRLSVPAHPFVEPLVMSTVYLYIHTYFSHSYRNFRSLINLNQYKKEHVIYFRELTHMFPTRMRRSVGSCLSTENDH